MLRRAAANAFSLSRVSTRRFANYSSEDLIKLDYAYGAHNYSPMPVVFAKAKGIEVWDTEGKKYYDFLSAYSAVNQGHCHPRIIEVIQQQAQLCTLSSRAFFNDQWPQFAEYVTKFFNFDMVLPMNTGAEAVETALKVTRKWGYMKKGIAPNEAIIVSCCGCFHGRTLGVISHSCDPEATTGFGPLPGGVMKVNYDDFAELEQTFNHYGPKIAGFLIEPIQGEAGVVVPSEGYLRKCKELCEKHNVLFMGDEVQTGIARTGKMLACDHEGVKPDVLILGKALSGGAYPVSAVLASKEVMLCIAPGEHGSTFGGNPLGSAIAMTALSIVKDEKLDQRAAVLGEKFRSEMKRLNNPLVSLVRGKGLLNAFVIDHNQSDKSAMDICMLLKHRGLLAKPTHDNIIRLAPPLVITEKQLDESIDIIQGALKDIVKMKREEIPGVKPKKPHKQLVCNRCGRDVD